MKSIRIILVFGFSTLILFGVLYPLVMVGIGKAVPHRANGLPIEKDGKLIGFENIGQPFDSPEYFWGRPSAVDYDASSTGGSNLGPSNPVLLELVQSRIDTLVKYHPGLKVEDIPVEMVTASGGGLDPHVSVDGAMLQVARIAQNRDIPEEKIIELIRQHTEGPWLGLFGPTDQVNVLKLNISLDQIN